MTAKQPKLVTTRKPHRCHGCRRLYPAGWKMYSQVVFGDEPYTLHTCLTCVRLEKFYDEREYPEGFVLDMMDNSAFTGTPEEYLEHMEEWTKPAQNG